MTAPVQFDSQNLSHWLAVLRNAAQVPRGDPRYDDARDVVEQALLQIRHLNRTANQEDRLRAGATAIPGDAALGVGLMHSLSLGAGEPIAGFIEKLRGGTFGEGAARYRGGLEEVGAQNPVLEPAGEVAGMLAPAAVPARTALMAARAPGAILDNLLSALRTVGEGATIGGIAGFSAGGDDPGDMDARLRAGGRSAAIGAALAGLFGAALSRARRGTPPPSGPKPMSLDFDLLPPESPPISRTNTPPVMSRRPILPSSADPLDVPPFLRRSVVPRAPEVPSVLPPSVFESSQPNWIELVRRLGKPVRRRRGS